MPTAPTFQSYKQLSEPFSKNGKLYVTVEHPNTHNSRDVRWYSDSEFAKTYGREIFPPVFTIDRAGRKHFKGLKVARGFANGPILVVRNNKPADEEWLARSVACFATNLGWYFRSVDPFPLDCPSHLYLVPLTFEEFTDNDEEVMKTNQALTNIISDKVRAKKFLSSANILGKEEIARK